jgi:hypothetical protein
MRLPFMLMLAALMPAAAAAAERICDQSETKATPAPGGEWVANVQHEVCDTGNGAGAAITVIIASLKDPAKSRRVFMMPVPRSRDDWPKVRWDSATAVELRVANLSEAPAPEPQYEGIRISLVYCNDNPSDRAAVVAYKAAVLQWQKDVTAWNDKRKQNADAAGARPPRPEEPRLSPGRCTD